MRLVRIKIPIKINGLCEWFLWVKPTGLAQIRRFRSDRPYGIWVLYRMEHVCRSMKKDLRNKSLNRFLDLWTGLLHPVSEWMNSYCILEIISTTLIKSVSIQLLKQESWAARLKSEARLGLQQKVPKAL